MNATGNRLAYPGSGDFIYQGRGDDTTLNRYSISGNSWSALASNNCGAATGDGSFLVRGDSGFLYASCPGGNGTSDFVRYSISGDSWANRATSPSGFGNGASAAWDGSDFIYALPGGSLTDFYRYTISSDTWTNTSVANPPASSTGGGSLTYPGSGDFLYAFRGGDTATFYRYSISGDSWTTLTAAPRTNGGGSALVAVDTSSIYAMCGACDAVTTFKDFWRYNIGSDSWTSLTDVPADVGAGGSLTYVSNSSGTFVYQLRGKTTTDFNRYTISLITSGGSAGSRLGPAATIAGLARAIPPNAPHNAVITSGICNGTCKAKINFSYTPLSFHDGRPTRFEYVNDTGAILGFMDVPVGTSGNYELELRNLAENAPLNGAVCAVFDVRRSCTQANGGTVYSINPDKIKITTSAEDIASGLFNAAIAFDATPNNALVGKTGFTLGVYAKNGDALKKISEDFLTFKTNPVPLPRPLPAGNYIFRLMPRNSYGVDGVASEKITAIAAPPPALDGKANVRIERGLLVAEISAALPRDIGNFLLIDPRFKLEKLMEDTGKESDLLPPALRAGFTFTLSITDKSTPPRTFRFEGACNDKSSKSCIIERVTNTVGNATGAIKPDVRRTAAGGGIAVAGDATLLWSPGFFPISTTLNQITAATFAINAPIQPIHAGQGALSVLIRDVFRNEKLFSSAPFTVSVPRAISKTTINVFEASQERNASGALQLVTRGSVTNNDTGPVLLTVNFADDADADMETTLRAFSIAVLRVDGLKISVIGSCDETCAIDRATMERAGDEAEDIVPTVVENEDGTVRFAIEGSIFTLDPANTAQFSVLIGAEDDAPGALPKQIAFAAGHDPLAQSGLYTATLIANDATAKINFLASGGLFDLGAVITPTNAFDLAPSFVFYPIPKNLPPQLEVEGGRIVPKPLLRRITDALAPTNPLLTILKNLISPEAAPEEPQDELSPEEMLSEEKLSDTTAE